MTSDSLYKLKFGIVLSKPVAFVFILIYLVQTAVLVYFVHQYFQDQETITFQQKQIADLQDKLQILKIIQDFQAGFDSTEVGQLANVIYNESKRYGYDPRLLISVILTESAMTKGEISYQGAHGLMQIKPTIGHELAQRQGIAWRGETSLFDPAYNVKLGSFYLFDLVMKFGDVKKALIAYNLGETEMRNRLLTNRRLPSQYLRKVMARYKDLVEKYPHS